jgi:butyrate kinase
MANDFQPSEMLCSKDYKKKKTVDFNYNINGHILERVTSNPYIGAELTNTMSWDKQVPAFSVDPCVVLCQRLY